MFIIIYRIQISNKMKPETKENIQYGTALTGLATGIIMCFLSFFLNNYDISGSVLGYLGEWIIFAAGIFGVSIYINSMFLKAESRMNKKIDDEFKEIEKKYHKQKQDSIFNIKLYIY